MAKEQNIKTESISSQSLNKEIAYLMGVYLTDGSIGNNGWNGTIFQIATIDKDFVGFTLECIKKIKPDCIASVYTRKQKDRHWGVENNYRISKCKDQHHLKCGFNPWGDFFLIQTGKKHHIPYLIWDAPLDIKRWFIAGIMDGDGTISYHTRTDGTIQWRVGIGGTEEGWIYEFQKLLNQLGVKTNKPEIRYRNKVFVNFTIKIQDFIEKGLFFKMERKQKRLLDFIAKRSETKHCPPEGVKI